MNICLRNKIPSDFQGNVPLKPRGIVLLSPMSINVMFARSNVNRGVI